MDLLRRGHDWNTVLFTVLALSMLLVFTGVWQLVFAAGLVGGILGKRARRDFGLGFLGGALGWGGHLLWVYAFHPAGELTALFVQILGLSAGLGALVLVITLLIGGIGAGLGALVGAYLGQLAFPAEEVAPVA